MSEYPYFERQARGRSSTCEQMDGLRRDSTRVRITPTSFGNEYQYGDFEGAPHAGWRPLSTPSSTWPLGAHAGSCCDFPLRRNVELAVYLPCDALTQTGVESSGAGR
jgi:hypothetical protein